MTILAADGHTGECDWNPTTPARPRTDTSPGTPQRGGMDAPSATMVANSAEIECLLALLARIVRRLASTPPARSPAREAAQRGAAPAATGAAIGEGATHRGCRCDPAS